LSRDLKEIGILKVRSDITSFHGRHEVKQKFLDRVRAHRLAGEITKDYDRKNVNGDAIGCTLHSDNKWAYEDELGIPNQLACIEDELFFSLANDQAQLFPEQFLEAIPVGADLFPAVWQFMLFALLDENQGMIALGQHQEAIRQAADFYLRALEGVEISWGEYLDARQALDKRDTQTVRGMLDALDPLDPNHYFSYIFDELARRDYADAMHGEEPWGGNYDEKRHQAAEAARAAIWRDKLLECLSSTEIDNQKLVG
jgi:hypothetical protein